MYLYKPKYKAATGEYRVATNYAVAFQCNGKRIVKTLQTPNRVAAQGRARLLIARTKERGWEILKPRLPGARLQYLDDFCQLYEKWASTREKIGRAHV